MIEPGRYVCLHCGRTIDSQEVTHGEKRDGSRDPIVGCAKCVNLDEAWGVQRFIPPEELSSGRRAAEAARATQIAQQVAAELD